MSPRRLLHRGHGSRDCRLGADEGGAPARLRCAASELAFLVALLAAHAFGLRRVLPPGLTHPGPGGGGLSRSAAVAAENNAGRGQEVAAEEAEEANEGAGGRVVWVRLL